MTPATDAPRARVLVVDDETSITDFVSYNLKREGYEVEVTATGEAALDAMAARAFDLVILDVMLPGPDGVEVCRRLRTTSDVPVLFLSAKDTEIDKVVGLEVGGDDYLAKPFGIHELLARVRALLRRSGGASRAEGRPDPAGPLVVGPLLLDGAAHSVTAAGVPLDLAPREFELLATLMRHAGLVLSRAQLLEQAWGWDVAVGGKTVDTHVKRLRAKLAQAGADPEMVETVRGYGYRLRR